MLPHVVVPASARNPGWGLASPGGEADAQRRVRAWGSGGAASRNVRGRAGGPLKAAPQGHQCSPLAGLGCDAIPSSLCRPPQRPQAEGTGPALPGPGAISPFLHSLHPLPCSHAGPCAHPNSRRSDERRIRQRFFCKSNPVPGDLPLSYEFETQIESPTPMPTHTRVPAHPESVEESAHPEPVKESVHPELVEGRRSCAFAPLRPCFRPKLESSSRAVDSRAGAWGPQAPNNLRGRAGGPLKVDKPTQASPPRGPGRPQSEASKRDTPALSGSRFTPPFFGLFPYLQLPAIRFALPLHGVCLLSATHDSNPPSQNDFRAVHVWPLVVPLGTIQAASRFRRSNPVSGPRRIRHGGAAKTRSDNSNQLKSPPSLVGGGWG